MTNSNQPPLTATMLFRGHAYSIILDIHGPWKGMVHIRDGEKLHDIFNSDVLMTGAMWDWQRGVIVLGDADVKDGWLPEMLEPATEQIRRELTRRSGEQN